MFVPLTRRGPPATPGGWEEEALGTWMICKSVTVGGKPHASHWAVAQPDGKIFRGGFLSKEAARDWARRSDPISRGGDVWLADNMTITPDSEVANLWRLTAPGWESSDKLIGHRYAKKFLDFAKHVFKQMHAKSPKLPGDFRGIAVNKITGKKRAVSCSLEILRHAMFDSIDQCVGSCRCRVETDGSCPNGWPSRTLACGVI